MTLPISKNPLRYGNAMYDQFCTEAEAAGFKPFHYFGKGDYEGPAVAPGVGQGQTLIQATAVRLQMDSMQLDLVYFPQG